MRHSLESRYAVIDVIRTSIGIGEARILVDRMHQVGAVVLRVAQMFRIKGRGDDGQSLIDVESGFP